MKTDSPESCRYKHSVDSKYMKMSKTSTVCQLYRLRSIVQSLSLYTLYVYICARNRIVFQHASAGQTLSRHWMEGSAWLGFKLGKAMDIKVGLRLL